MIERLDAYMARANSAYYATQNPFHDFMTSPEISQVFGELLGVWAAVCWRAMGKPSPFLLVEAGPGRGTMMEDALRATGRLMSEFNQALRLHLIEASPRLRTLQSERFPTAMWHSSIEGVPDGAFILLANEFLDALPIRQFVRRCDGWRERFVNASGFVERPSLPSEWAGSWGDDPVGQVREVCPAACQVIENIAQRLRRHPGVALFIDYGFDDDVGGDSLQAIVKGRPAPLFSVPGTADLSAHVNFSSLADIARRAGMLVHGPIPQGAFLARLGLFQRTNMLSCSLPAVKAVALMNSAKRLAEPDQMGRLFKAMAISHPDIRTCPGFDD